MVLDHLNIQMQNNLDEPPTSYHTGKLREKMDTKLKCNSLKYKHFRKKERVKSLSAWIW